MMIELERQRRTNVHRLQLRRLFVSGGLLAVLDAAGFGTYVASSVALSSVAQAIGVALPFSVFTTASQLVAVSLGPIGWATLIAGLTLPTAKRINDTRLVPIIVWVCAADSERRSYEAT